MKRLQLFEAGEALSVLCLGAHSDDIEIGAGATVMTMIADGCHLNVHWCVLSGGKERDMEARSSAADFLKGSAHAEVEILNFRDGFFPQEGEAVKSWFEALKARVNPDIVFTHNRADAHQDHREVSRLTWNTFRDHCILEYEIPKWDGDMGRPNLFMPISGKMLQRKTELLIKHFGTQRSKHWFDAETFGGLARLRGLECHAPERYAEAFYAHKLSLA